MAHTATASAMHHPGTRLGHTHTFLYLATYLLTHHHTPFYVFFFFFTWPGKDEHLRDLGWGIWNLGPHIPGVIYYTIPLSFVLMSYFEDGVHFLRHLRVALSKGPLLGGARKTYFLLLYLGGFEGDVGPHDGHRVSRYHLHV